ncbi:efflux RND transporter periplasmic adaptor subunit [bacterium]|nr:efflux RND transporter periplasmic adaptor subunit [bacterium]MBU1599191.1 efflux RND transporter periplasmic adaptor subunit [bacterium]MBU2461982.1 efflux RND transporter periplasmic adaptor subunit [bacterium]
MKRGILIIGVLLLIVSGVFIITRHQAEDKAPSHKEHTVKEQQIYYCPMHPNYTSSKPGECPICGMDLVLKKKEEKKVEKGEVYLTPEKQQLIGVKTDTVRYNDLVKKVRAKGIVSYDERKIFIVNTKFEGWIEELFVNYTGKFVKEGDPLFTVYSPELVSAQEEYLLALRSRNISEGSEFAEIKESQDMLISSARKRLKLWDISDEQIKKLEETGQIKKRLTIYSPYSGFVVEKMAIKGARIMPGDMLYKIANTSSVWIIADVYEQDIPFVKLGQMASISLLSMPQKALSGKISYIYPYLEEEIRTVKVRIEVPNNDFILKPNMYANIEVNVGLGRRLSVLESAVIDTGERQIAILSKGDGYFKPVEVKVGVKVEDYYEVLSGLTEGDKVVVKANFLIDSESKMKEALSGMGHEGGHQ